MPEDESVYPFITRPNPSRQPHPNPTHHPSHHPHPTPPHTHTQQKAGEAASLEARVRELEATRDALAEELLNATNKAEQVSNHRVAIGSVDAQGACCGLACTVWLEVQVVSVTDAPDPHPKPQPATRIALLPRQAATAEKEAAALRVQCDGLRARYAAAVELAGER
jgi:hypothetical protein